MKKLTFIISLLFIGMIGLLAQNQYSKEENPAFYEITSVQRIMVQAAAEVMEAENKLGMEIVRLEFDLILGNDWKYSFRNLSPNWTYLVYAQGENIQTADLDLKVMTRNSVSGDWEEVTSDTRENVAGMVAVSPTEGRQYAIGVKIAKYKEGFTGTHYFIMIAHKKPE